MMCLIAAATLVCAQEPPKTPDHVAHVRPFKEIRKEIEKARAELTAFTAVLAVMRSDNAADRTDTATGKLAFRLDDKKAAMLAWTLPAARGLHDGKTLTVTDAEERTFKTGEPWSDPRFFAAELILNGGCDLENHFTVRVTCDPGLAKKERGNKGKIEDDLENPVGPYHLELTPLDSALARRIAKFAIDLDPVTMLPTSVVVSTESSSLTVVMRDVVKVEPKELADDLFKLDLAGLKKE